MLPVMALHFVSQMKVVQPLLAAMGNTHYPDSQRQAALALKVCMYAHVCVSCCVCVGGGGLLKGPFNFIQVLLSCDEGVKKYVEQIMGGSLFYKFWVTHMYTHTHTHTHTHAKQYHVTSVNLCI